LTSEHRDNRSFIPNKVPLLENRLVSSDVNISLGSKSYRVAMGSSSYNRDKVISSISNLYKLLIKLPYVDPEALVYPPTDENKNGWTGINETELRKRGKTDRIVDLLRHLPYLRQPKSINEADNHTAGDHKWMISPGTITIAYCDGDVYDEKMDHIQPTPDHCIWLTDLADGDDGTALLLDSHTG
jgi:hypothetical protein